MNNLKIKGYDNLEKDPESGAILLTPTNNIVEMKVGVILKKMKHLQNQNEEILSLLKILTEKKDS